MTRTLRAYNARQKQWELVSTEKGSGLQNLGTGQREGAEVHPTTDIAMLIEQEKSELLRRADSAMYQAKSKGKNQVVVSRSRGPEVSQ